MSIRLPANQVLLEGGQRPITHTKSLGTFVVGERMKLGSSRSYGCIQEQPTGGMRQHLAFVLQEGRENANIDAGLGFIWRISV